MPPAPGCRWLGSRCATVWLPCSLPSHMRGLAPARHVVEPWLPRGRSGTVAVGIRSHSRNGKASGVGAVSQGVRGDGYQTRPCGKQRVNVTRCPPSSVERRPMPPTNPPLAGRKVSSASEEALDTSPQSRCGPKRDPRPLPHRVDRHRGITRPTRIQDFQSERQKPSNPRLRTCGLQHQCKFRSFA